MTFLNLHVALCGERLIMNGFGGHPFHCQFTVLCRMVHFPNVGVTRQSKVGYLDQFAFTNEDISRRQVTMDETLSGQKFLCEIRKENFDHYIRGCYWKATNLGGINSKMLRRSSEYQTQHFKLQTYEDIIDLRSYVHNLLAVVKLKPEKNSGLNGIGTHELCDTVTVLYLLPCIGRMRQQYEWKSKLSDPTGMTR